MFFNNLIICQKSNNINLLINFFTNTNLHTNKTNFIKIKKYKNKNTKMCKCNNLIIFMMILKKYKKTNSFF